MDCTLSNFTECVMQVPIVDLALLFVTTSFVLLIPVLLVSMIVSIYRSTK